MSVFFWTRKERPDSPIVCYDFHIGSQDCIVGTLFAKEWDGLVQDASNVQYKISFCGKNIVGKIDCSGCLSNRRISFCKEEVENRLYKLAREEYEKAKEALGSFDEYNFVKLEKAREDADYTEEDILK